MDFAQRCGSKYKDIVGGEMVKKRKKVIANLLRAHVDII